MDSEIAAIREQIDRQVRPGQVGAATVANRLSPAAGPGGGLASVNVYDWTAGAQRLYGCYRRGRYGAARYLQVV